MHESKKGLEAKVGPSNITPTGPLGNFVLPIFTTMGSIGLEVQVPKESALLLGEMTAVPFDYNL